MVHVRCHVWSGWGHIDLITFPCVSSNMSAPAPSQHMSFLVHTATSGPSAVAGLGLLWPHCTASARVTGLKGCPNIKPIS